MAYIPPPASALDFVFAHSLYAPPPGNAVNFDLSSINGITYPRIPGVIKDVGTSWRPRPEQRQSTLSALFEEAGNADILRRGNASQASAHVDPEKAMPHENATPFNHDRGVAWDPVSAKEVKLASAHEQAEPSDIQGRASPWEMASQHLDPKTSSSFRVKTPWKDRQLASIFYSSDLYGRLWRREENTPAPLAKPFPGLANLGFLRIRKISESSLYELAPAFEHNQAQPKDVLRTFTASAGTLADIAKALPWGPAGSRDTTLVFTYPDYPGPIEFPGTFTIPTLRFYVVANSAQIVRVSDGTDVPADSVTMSINSDQYTWSMSATLASGAAKALVEGVDGEPVEVDVMVNGVTWRVLVDAWSTSQAWNKDQVQISGRSRAAYLAAPYTAGRDYAENSSLLAGQLAAQELPPGWNLEWNMVDWFVPGGVWQYQGLTPIEAVSRIAQAGAGYVQADPFEDKLIVNPLYPDAPWNLATLGPDIQVPIDVVMQRSSRKQPGQVVNGVYVFGGAVAPYHAQVIRRQTNGLPLAPQVVDSLITERIPAEARGIAAMAATGRQALETHELPLDADLGGLIPVGSLLEVGRGYGVNFLPDWRGLVRGVSVSAKAAREGNGGVRLKVRQNLTILRHYDEGP